MTRSRRTDAREVEDEARSVVLDVLRRRAAGESLPDEQVIASRPDLADLLRAELAKLQQICAAGIETSRVVLEHASTADRRSVSTPGLFQARCPHCRAFSQASGDAPVDEIACSVCGGQFTVADVRATARAAPPFESLAQFDLGELLGVGGFGSVWKARDCKLDRTVAVKIPHRGQLNDKDLEKFLREARATAQLQHPNIVRVHEAGRHGDSAYIISDFVRGVPLDDWLNDRQPTNRQVAEICATLADALQHAHDHGVIHRDLKPANILMDDEQRPHLTDFGLAKREVGEVTVTMDGQILGTPAYMSPEQAQGEAHTADGRSDVYSLGVILFELLTGERPFRGNPGMLINQVLHDPAPSPRKFHAGVPKDLETITLKCLEKDRNRRYQTARELGDELRRFLASEPIRARPIGGAERAWRWARRRPAAAALLILLALVASGSATAFLRERDLRREVIAQKSAATARQVEAEAVVSFVTQDVLANASPARMQDKTVRDVLVKTLIEPAAATVGERFQSQPLVEASIRRTLAQILIELGRPDLALPHAEIALRQRLNALGDAHPDTLTSRDNYALVLNRLGRAQEAEPLFGTSLQQRRQTLGEGHLDAITSLNNYADVLNSLGRTQEAEPLLESALEQRRKALGENHPLTIAALCNYAIALASTGRLREAHPLLSRAYEQRRDVLGENHPDTMQSLNCYALVLSRLGRATEAEPLFRRALEQRRQVLDEDHPDAITSLINCADVLATLGREEEAEPLLKKALDRRRQVLGKDHPDTVLAQNAYAALVQSLGRTHGVESLAARALDQRRDVPRKDRPDTE